MAPGELSLLLSASAPIDLTRVAFPRITRVAVLGPHPDDLDAIAVTMRLFRDCGCRIDLAIVTDGASGVEDGYLGATTAAERGAIRVKEQQASLRFFRLPDDQTAFLHLEEDYEGHPIAGGRNLERISEFLARSRPDAVFLPHGNDTNPGHRRTYEMFRMYIEQSTMPAVAFLIKDPKTIGIRVDCYTGYSEDTARWKSAMLLHHQSQHARNLRTRQHGFDERILRVNRQAAAELGLKLPFAEAFQLQWFEDGRLLPGRP